MYQNPASVMTFRASAIAAPGENLFDESRIHAAFARRPRYAGSSDSGRLAEEISEDTVSNRMEWELALREAMKQLKFRIINQENSFELFDDAGKRLYFGSDCRSAAERALMKILFPINFQ